MVVIKISSDGVPNQNNWCRETIGRGLVGVTPDWDDWPNSNWCVNYVGFTATYSFRNQEDETLFALRWANG